MKFKEYWDDTHKKYMNNKITYDLWLDSYLDIINNCKTKVLDLGCGMGNDSLYLTEKGLDVIACDYSEVALDCINKHLPKVETKLIDISLPLPFKDNSFDLIIADLSLHYFDEVTTKNIMLEIKRILSKNGHLIARVNSIDDINYGSNRGERIEDNFYYVDGYNKRFFDIKDTQKFFSLIGKPQIKENEMLRYSKPKKVIEVVVEKE